MIELYHSIVDRIQGKAPKGASRSSQWRTVRKEHLKEESVCQVCSKNSSLEVHHIIPFYEDPSLELEPENLVTLCRRCHLFIGHIGYYRAINTSCLEDVALWSFKFSERRRTV